MKVGFVGLGIMGAPMASNVLQAGFPLFVYNRTAAKCAPLVEMGAQACSTPAELAAKVDVAITIVSDTPDVEAVLFAEDGLAKGLQAGAMPDLANNNTIPMKMRPAATGG